MFPVNLSTTKDQIKQSRTIRTRKCCLATEHFTYYIKSGFVSIKCYLLYADKIAVKETEEIPDFGNGDGELEAASVVVFKNCWKHCHFTSVRSTHSSNIDSVTHAGSTLQLHTHNGFPIVKISGLYPVVTIGASVLKCSKERVAWLVAPWETICRSKLFKAMLDISEILQDS